jgi:iron complex outermembrane receptor protein
MIVDRRIVACVSLVSLVVVGAERAGTTSLSNSALKSLSIEELVELEVTTVSRHAERLASAPSSIFVITADVIRRSGVTSLPEALRLAPNLQVARIDATQYAISARGFNNAVGNKLLVLIDGRTVYTPIFSGVFWDQQDVLLDDVDRIEVISGPGATLWGANAVNGVINVITRKANETHGELVSVVGGDQEVGAALRYGGATGGGTHYRVYLKAAQLQNTHTAAGAAVADGYERVQAGFRADWQAGNDAFTLQGDVYGGRAEDRGAPNFGPIGRIKSSGANLLTRWTRQFEDSDLLLQAYVDHAERTDTNTFSPQADVFDLELQHSLRFGQGRFVWGAGLRHGHDEVDPGMFLGLIPAGFIPASSNLDWWNVYGQGEFDLPGNVTFAAGLKLERNEYTGVEVLPSLRLSLRPSPRFLGWAAVSHAVRAPSRIDRELFLPTTPPFLIAGGPDFKSEVANVFELGVRGQAAPDLTLTATLFWHEWDRLRSGSAPIAVLGNEIHGSAYGAEAWGTWDVAQGWRLSFQGMLRASVDLAPDQTLDATLRHVGKLRHPEVPDYTALDLRYAWQASRSLEISLIARNALDASHPEFNDPSTRSEIERGIYGQLRWSR